VNRAGRICSIASADWAPIRAGSFAGSHPNAKRATHTHVSKLRLDTCYDHLSTATRPRERRVMIVEQAQSPDIERRREWCG
jgi:hypothetical protein